MTRKKTVAERMADALDPNECYIGRDAVRDIDRMVRRAQAEAWDGAIDWQLQNNLILESHVAEPKKANPYRRVKS